MNKSSSGRKLYVYVPTLSLSLSHAHTQTHTCTHTDTHTHTHTYTHSHSHSHTHIHTHSYTNSLTLAFLGTYTHTQIHTHINTFSLTPSTHTFFRKACPYAHLLNERSSLSFVSLRCVIKFNSFCYLSLEYLSSLCSSIFSVFFFHSFVTKTCSMKNIRLQVQENTINFIFPSNV